MKIPRSILLVDFFGASAIHTREQAQRLCKQAEQLLLLHEPVWLDFCGIAFISRSFADEMLRLFLPWKALGKADWLGLAEDVKQMLDKVQQKREQAKPASQLIPSLPIHTEEELTVFFATI